MADDKGESLTGDRKIIEQAKKRFKQCADWESAARQRFIEDVKFCEGDSDNGYQWEASTRLRRMNAQGGPRPCLTINKTRQHCLQIINDERQNKAQIEVRPVGDGATYQAAKIYEGIVRHIEYRSNAQIAYDTASWHQIVGGIGFWRVLTEYADPDSFEQEIKIQRIADPLSVYLDRDIQEYDGSDARFGFVFRDIPRDQFDTEHPEWKDKFSSSSSITEGSDSQSMGRSNDWENKDYVRVAEYIRKSDTPDRLILLQDGRKFRKSQLRDEDYAELDDSRQIVAERATTKAGIEWFKIAGSEIVDKGKLPGTFIPIVRVPGEEVIINGMLDRKGHTRSMKDPQRMYNWQSSTMVETLALQSRSPWIGPKETFEGLETVWDNANNDNLPYLAYNAFDESGKPLTAPQRQIPGQMGPAVVQAMQIAQNEMMMVTGQYQSQFGENENAKSGIAIQTRQRQGDNATYHYIDHLAQAIRFTGRILIQWIPEVYDTPRVIKIMAEDGDQTEVHVDPSAQAPQMQVGPDGQQLTPQQVQQMQAEAELADKIKTIFNPTVGKYDVEADIGPAYATRRQETFNALSQIMTNNPKAMEIGGDIMFRAADFPMADELAERFERAVPANIRGIGPPPELEQALQQNQALHGILQNMSQQLSEAQDKLKQGAADADLKAYDAETRRMSAVGSIDPEAFKPVIRELISQALQTPIHPVMDAHAELDQARMPQESPETVQ